MNPQGAYAGLRVLDLGQGVAAPYCAMLLAMHGAEIVKVEPLAGDWSRGLGMRYGDHTAMSAHYNRGKRSLALDLKAQAGREIAWSLAGRADVVIEGFRPGVAARLGLGYDELRVRNPRLLYVSVSGFGQEGPYVGLPCTDSVAQAFSGLMSVNLGNDGTPHRVGAIIVDTLTGLYAAQAVGVALYARERRGEGRRIEVSLAQCAAAILGHKLAEHVLEGGAPRQLNVPTGAYRTRDGWIIVALVREEQYARLAGALGRPDLADDPRFADFAARAAHSLVLTDIVGRIIATDTTEGWLGRLRAADILADRVNGFDDWLADPHIVATGGAVTVEQPEMGQFPTPRTPGISFAVDAALPPAPRIGEHGAAILAEIGIDPAMIAGLCAENILLIPQ
jgi:crotonobetainyl-CoA:carnitine CoA-transferase CaiB-like acyl-CoA transferase